MRLIRRRPLVGITISFLAGVWSAFRFSGNEHIILVVMTLSFFAAVAAQFICRDLPFFPFVRHMLIYTVIGTIGYKVGLGSISGRSIDSISRVIEAAQDNSMVSIEGVIVGDVEERQLSGERLMWSFPLRVDCLRSDSVAQKLLDLRLSCRLFEEKPGSIPRYGQRWLFKGRLMIYPPMPSSYLVQSDCFDEDVDFLEYRSIEKKLFFSGNLHDSVFIDTEEGSYFFRRIYTIRKQSADILSAGVADFPLSCGVSKALLLGYRSNVPWPVRRLFAETGTLHIFAISGLHVGLVTAIIVFILGAAGISRERWIWFLVPMLAIYIMATGAKPSAVRAGIMAVAFFAAHVFGRRSDPISSLSFAALIIVALSPVELVLPGFVFSFCIVTGLIVMYPLFAPFIEKLAGSDPLQVVKESRGRKALRYVTKYFLVLFFISASAWLVSTPLAAYFFGRVSPVALVGNLAVIPLAFLIVLTASLSLISGSVFVPIAVIFNHANVAFTSMLVRIIGFLHKLPAASLEVRAPSLLFVVGWYFLLSLIVGYLFHRVGLLSVNPESDCQEPLS